MYVSCHVLEAMAAIRNQGAVTQRQDKSRKKTILGEIRGSKAGRREDTEKLVMCRAKWLYSVCNMWQFQVYCVGLCGIYGWDCRILQNPLHAPFPCRQNKLQPSGDVGLCFLCYCTFMTVQHASMKEDTLPPGSDCEHISTTRTTFSQIMTSKNLQNAS